MINMKKKMSAINDIEAAPAGLANASAFDRRSFIMRNAVIGAAAVMTGKTWTPEARAQQAAKEAAPANPSLPPLNSTSMSTDLKVAKKCTGRVMTILE